MMKKGDKRPVKCYICKKQMYYIGHPKHEPEFELINGVYKGFVHKRCVRNLRS